VYQPSIEGPMKFNRRKFVTSLSAFPLIGSWIDALKVPPPQEPLKRDNEWKVKFLAVQIVRFVNTIEAWNFNLTGKHVRLSDLSTCPGFSQLVANEKLVKTHFKRVVPYFATNQPKIPGYDIWVENTDDGSRYSALVWMQGPDYSFGFASNEAGLIYEGSPLASRGNEYVGIDQLLSKGQVLGGFEEKEEVRWWPRLANNYAGRAHGGTIARERLRLLPDLSLWLCDEHWLRLLYRIVP
jgi:hypothetical protein